MRAAPPDSIPPDLQAQADAYARNRRDINNQLHDVYVKQAHNQREQAELRAAMLGAEVHNLVALGEVKLGVTRKAYGVNIEDPCDRPRPSSARADATPGRPALRGRLRPGRRNPHG